MILLILLRLLLLLKWLFQTPGIVLAIGVPWWGPKRIEVIVFFSLAFLIIPELIMGCAIWIGKGVSAYKIQTSNEKFVPAVPIFGKSACTISFCFYVAILTSISMLVGMFLEIPILLSGLTLLFSGFWHKKMKCIFDKYLEIIS